MNRQPRAGRICGQRVRKAGEPPMSCDLDRPCPIHGDPGELAYEAAIERQVYADARRPSYGGEGRDL